MTVGYDNIFPIADADNYTCSLYRYEVSHSGLYLKVSNSDIDETSFYLYFPDFSYIAAPVSWRSVDFQLLGHRDERDQALQAIGCFNKWPDEYLRRIQIYTIEKPHLHIMILAAGVEKIQKLSIS